MHDCLVCRDKQAATHRKEAARIGNYRLSDFDWGSYPADAEGIAEKEHLVRDFCEGYAEYEKEQLGLFIYGSTCGSGKTHLAECICGEVVEHWEKGSARMCSEADILEMARQKPDDGTDPLTSVIGCRLLVLDDIGQKKSGRAWLDDCLFQIIDSRNRGHRITLYTSNCDMKSLPDGGRIADRINEHTIPVHMPDVSIRARQAAEKKAAFLRGRGVT